MNFLKLALICLSALLIFNTRKISTIVAGENDSHPSLIFGFYENSDEASLKSLRKHIGQLTYVVPVWIHLKGGDGNISVDIDPVVEELARKADVPIIPLINNYQDAWQPRALHKVLQREKSRTRIVKALSELLSARHYAGINIDLELLQARDREKLITFMRELFQELHPRGFLVTASVPVDNPAYDLRQLSRFADFLIPMFYDEHFDTGKPGPVASFGWFEKMFLKVQAQIPPRKLIAGLGNFGYDWLVGTKKAASINFSDVMRLAREHGAQVITDKSSSNPVLFYSEGKRKHELWFLDAHTLSKQWRFAQQHGIRGLALWRLGTEDPRIWNAQGPLGPQ